MTPYFENFSDFLHMGGHGFYVWMCYGMVFGCFFGLIWYVKAERKHAIAKLTRQSARSEKLTNKQRKELNA